MQCANRLVKQETEYQLIELCCSVSLFLVLWSNFHGMKTIRQEGVRLRGVQYKPNRMGEGGGGGSRLSDKRRLFEWRRLLDHFLNQPVKTKGAFLY